MDLLRVDVVKIINDSFAAAGKSVMPAEELIKAVKDDPAVWDLYAKGYTQGLNQCERPKTTQRVMQFKPLNIVELTAFVAAIRPGAKTLVDDLVMRRPHSYNIPSMDKLLKLDGATGVTGESAFLLYDEQILTLAKAAGIDPGDAYLLIKHIKKKHHDEVASYKEKFIPGFMAYLREQKQADSELAEKTANDVWTVILNSASYLFRWNLYMATCIENAVNLYIQGVRKRANGGN